MEALAGPASVITVASLAIQVCEELKKVHEFWQSVKEAPDDVAHVSTEINLFLAWLAIIANNYQRQGLNHKSPTEAAATETLKVCLATAHDMNGVVKHVESGYSKGSLTRRWASVKFVFRKDKTGKIMAQIERMKALLIMVQNCYLGDMQEAGFKSLSLSLRPEDHPLQTTDIEHSFNTTTTASADEDLVIETRPLQPTPESLVELVSFSPTASPPAPRRPKHRTKNQERAYNFGLAMLRLVATDQESIFFEESGKERRIFSRTIRYDLRLAQWLSSRGLSWYPFGIYGNWKENLRTFRYVPQDSLIVDFCVEGDLANVQRMFDKRMASPFDRVDRGFRGDWSLLHFAIANCHTQLCKFLIECGLGRSSASGISEHPILSLIGYCSQDRTAFYSTTQLDILRIMINEGQYDPMEKAGGTTVMHSFDGTPTVYRWLLSQDVFMIDLKQKDDRAANVAAALSRSFGLNASKHLEAVIAYGSGLNDLVASYSLAGVAFHLVLHLPNLADNVDLPNRVKVLWDAGADFHAIDHGYSNETALEVLSWFAAYNISPSDRTEYNKYGVDRQWIPSPSLMSRKDVIEYDRLEDTSDIKYRPRTSRSLWRTWYPGESLSILEIVQRYLDAWMEVLLEAGLDIVAYGRREEELHPGGKICHSWGEARLVFEYGDHVNGCRIHVTEIWVADPNKAKAVSAETSTMPCSWDFRDE